MVTYKLPEISTIRGLSPGSRCTGEIFRADTATLLFPDKIQTKTQPKHSCTRKRGFVLCQMDVGLRPCRQLV